MGWENKSSEKMRKGTKKKLKSAKEAFLLFYTWGTPNNLQTSQKFKVPDFRDVSVTLTASHCHSSSLDILSSSVCQESKHHLVIYCLTNVFKKNDFFVVKWRVFSILWVARQSSHSYYPTIRRRSGWIVYPPLHGSFKQRGHGRIWQSKQSEANVVVTNKIATTSTVTSSHTTLGSVTSIGPHYKLDKPDMWDTAGEVRTNS